MPLIKCSLITRSEQFGSRLSIYSSDGEITASKVFEEQGEEVKVLGCAGLPMISLAGSCHAPTKLTTAPENNAPALLVQGATVQLCGPKVLDSKPCKSRPSMLHVTCDILYRDTLGT